MPDKQEMGVEGGVRELAALHIVNCIDKNTHHTANSSACTEPERTKIGREGRGEGEKRE